MHTLVFYVQHASVDAGTASTSFRHDHTGLLKSCYNCWLFILHRLARSTVSL